eukprot:gene13338-biopygen9970
MRPKKRGDSCRSSDTANAAVQIPGSPHHRINTVSNDLVDAVLPLLLPPLSVPVPAMVDSNCADAGSGGGAGHGGSLGGIGIGDAAARQRWWATPCAGGLRRLCEL